MNKNIKNILLFVGIGIVLFLVYFFFIKSDGKGLPGIVSTAGNNSKNQELIDSAIADSKEALNILSNLKYIKLDDSIFSDFAFTNLHDTTATIQGDGTEGRPNPFAPVGVDAPTLSVDPSPLSNSVDEANLLQTKSSLKDAVLPESTPNPVDTKSSTSKPN